MKKGILYSILALVLMTSCQKMEKVSENYWSTSQREILDVLKGQFSYTLPVVDWTTTIEFLEQFNPPKTIIVKGEEREYYVHGMYRITYYNGSSFERYYHIAYDGQSITSSPRLDWSSTNVQEFSLINSTQFKIKEIGATLWDTYTKQ